MMQTSLTGDEYVKSEQLQVRVKANAARHPSKDPSGERVATIPFWPIAHLLSAR